MARLQQHSRFLTAAVVTAAVPLVAAGSASSAASSGSASAAAAPPPVVVELLSRGTVDKPFEAKARGIELETKSRMDVAVVRVTYPPGSTSGWHTHPGPTVVTATKGTFRHMMSDCSRRTIKAGDTFIEKGPREVGVLRNVGDTTAQIVITFFVPVGADPLTIPKPTPQCAR